MPENATLQKDYTADVKSMMQRMDAFQKEYDKYSNNVLLVLTTLKEKYNITASVHLNENGILSYQLELTQIIDYIKGQEKSLNP
jgi:hypothetical protein